MTRKQEYERLNALIKEYRVLDDENPQGSKKVYLKSASKVKAKSDADCPEGKICVDGLCVRQ